MPRATSRFPAPNTGFPYLVFRTTPRDRYLATMLFEHRVLTSEHIARLAFTTLRRANQRLAELTELGIVDRSRANPAVYGSSPYLYTLGPQGAQLVAGERDTTMKELRYDRGVLLRQAVRRDLPHTLGCNTAMVRLATRHRTSPDVRLHAWLGALSCMRRWGDIAPYHREGVRADAYALTSGTAHPTDEQSRFAWFFEYDTGSESINQLARKLRGYQNFAHEYRGHYPVLVRVPNTARETRLHEVIAKTHHIPCTVPVATTTSDDLGAAVWRIVSDEHLPAPVYAGQRSPLSALGFIFTTVGYRLLEPLTGGDDEDDEYVPAPTMDQP
ncbi:replication-relaxation family protein [Actinospica sp. MGRD01-02]|uniref:Replication-relaxation family protein n=1 Tax=Actinospica acidithermotolerans TaxID=2828514 RepID=A0A941E3Z4_9ACTN|nr:replication-relaxation family protein [Actinospica acidithermotolerans]MBR7824686.1 replication-relaxation family protein [Actinospica acidithermotolerans]